MPKKSSKDEQQGDDTRLSEILLLIRNEIQQAIEYLSLPEVRVISTQAPSTAFVNPNKIKVRVPLSFQFKEMDIQKDVLEKYTLPIRPLTRAEKTDIAPSDKTRSLIMHVK